MTPCPPTAVEMISIAQQFCAVSPFTYAIRPLPPEWHGVRIVLRARGAVCRLKPRWRLSLSSSSKPDRVVSADGESKGGGGEILQPKRHNIQTPPGDMEPSALAALSGVIPTRNYELNSTLRKFYAGYPLISY